jgi:hypothetical protein
MKHTQEVAAKQSAVDFEYGEGSWYGSVITTHGRAKIMRLDEGIERNHLVPKAFLLKGPKETKHLGDYVPVLPISFNEHRGKQFSFHMMRDGQKVPDGKRQFKGCGLNAYLRSKSIDIDATSFTANEVAAAIDALARHITA